MKKPLIGIMPLSNYMKTDNPSKDTYSYTNTYIRSLMNYDCIPYFIPLLDNKVIDGTLDNLDGLFLQGGFWASDCHFEILDYVFKKKKPILGVCLGMQEIAMYSAKLDSPDIRIMKDIDTGVNHRPYEITRDNPGIIVHDISIVKDTKLYDIFKTDKLAVNSLHQRTISSVGHNFKISAYSTDGLIEGIEYFNDNSWVMGVQFHPELVKELEVVYETFVNECRNRMK